ncbi:hypothetical protein [Heyndrickxia coagulans]|uniref:hypothetical protein n=1 Tax=Heyndrickxia coagulans TaxID=1398 RepID=UPI000377C514|nr:hypothetical protein [Heyndrickxia coagulans]
MEDFFINYIIRYLLHHFSRRIFSKAGRAADAGFSEYRCLVDNLATGSEYMNDNLYFIEKRVGFISHFILQLLNNLLGWSA